MTPANVNALVLTPALRLLGPKFDSPMARIELVAIAIQESGLHWRIQQPNGPARSYWQFEAGGGVRALLLHPLTQAHMRRVCAEMDYSPVIPVIHSAMAHNDLLAACMARLLLYTDPRPLPTNARDGWTQYKENWRPGKPHPATWVENYRIARETVAAF